MQTSKFNIGDRVSFKNETGNVVKCTVRSVGVLGGKLTPRRAYLYDIKPDGQDYIIRSILERALTKIED
jgi:hypothetical protein